ncbi:hypothetical protein MASR2M69_07190 [Bacteroidota bacterium]
MKPLKLIGFCLVIINMPLIIGCTETNFENIPTLGEARFYARIESHDDIITKLPIESGEGIPNGESVGIFGLQYTGADISSVVWPSSESSYELYNNSGTASGVSPQIITPSATYYYPTSGRKVALYSYYPRSATVEFNSLSPPYALIQIPASPASQKDYLWSTPVTGTSASPAVTFVYKHALSMLRFRVQQSVDNSVTVKSVTIETYENQSAKMNIADGTLFAATGGETIFALTGLSQSVATSSFGTSPVAITGAKFLFIPGSTIKSVKCVVRLASESSDREYVVNDPSITFLKGEAKDINFVIQSKTVATVAAWSEKSIVEQYFESEPVAANCYMADSDRTLDGAVVGIATSQVTAGLASITGLSFTPSSAWTCGVLWHTWNPVSTGKQLTVTRISDNFIRVAIPRGLNGNSALIVLREASTNVILWSWHIWITDYVPEPNGTPSTTAKKVTHKYAGDAFLTGGTLVNKVMMDRNLGASWTGSDFILPSVIGSTAATAAKAYGMLYQWGRKDPFPGSATGTTTERTLYNTAGSTVTVTRTAVPSSTNAANAVRNPLTYYYRSTNKYDWFTTNGTQNNTLWSTTSTKSVYDPCPPGWRVFILSTTSTINPFSGFYDGSTSNTAGGSSASTQGTHFQHYYNGAVNNTTNGATSGRLYTLYSGSATSGASAWFPKTGYRTYNTGALTSVGTTGNIWGAGTSSVDAYRFNYTLTNVYPASVYRRAEGYPVRCIQE